MDERERAETLARAIDAFFLDDAHDPETTPLDDADFASLLAVARARQATGQAAVRTAITYEANVWQRLIERMSEERQPAAAPTVSDAIATRRTMTREARTAAERHRDGVWSRLHERLFARPVATPAHAAAHFQATGDPRVDSLVRVAMDRGQATQAQTDISVQQLIQARLLLDTGRRHARIIFDEPAAPLWPVWARTAAAVAVIAAAVLAIGPLPATGVAHHPAVELARDLGERLGLTETAEGPTVPSDVSTVEGAPATAAQASAALGATLGAPETLPGAFSLTSAEYYGVPITADDRGVYTLVYEAADGGSLVVYQERASGADVAAYTGSSVATEVSGVAATYFSGAWQTADGSTTWDISGAQTLVFDDRGVRTIVRYTGPQTGPAMLIAAGETLLASR